MAHSFCIVFPGQGSQSVGMLSELAQRYPGVRATFAEASTVLGFDLWELVEQGPKERLDETVNTQPAMLAAGVAVYRVWEERGGPSPLLMAGHSLGEYSALVCAGALDFQDTVSLVAERARLMQEAVPEGRGAMAAILGLDENRVREVCAEYARGAVVEAVNFNAPGQIVVAGEAEAVSRVVAGAKVAGAKRAVPLPVSVPSHCQLMRPAAERLALRLGSIGLRPPAFPVLHNVSVAEARDPDDIRRLLARQLYSPVRWVETVQAMAAAGTSYVLEFGPGKVLTGLTKRIDSRVSGLAVFDEAGLQAAQEAVRHVEG